MQTEINLLPWREERRQTRQREFLLMLLGAAIIGVACWWLWNQAVNSSITNQTSRNQYVQTHINQLNEKIKEISALEKQRAELISRMKVIQGLQGNRPHIVHLFDQLVRTLPDGVYFSSISRNGTTFNIQGMAENNNQISNLMRNLDKSDWFSSPILKTVVAKGENANEFSLTVKQSSPSKDDDKGGNK